MCLSESLAEDEDERHGARGHHRVGGVLREGGEVDDLKEIVEFVFMNYVIECKEIFPVAATGPRNSASVTNCHFGRGIFV